MDGADPTPKSVKTQNESLAGLAALWDKCEELRHAVIHRKSLLAWQSAKLNGRINNDNLQLNIKLMECVVSLWCPMVEKAKTLPLEPLKHEAIEGLNHLF